MCRGGGEGNRNVCAVRRDLILRSNSPLWAAPGVSALVGPFSVESATGPASRKLLTGPWVNSAHYPKKTY